MFDLNNDDNDNHLMLIIAIAMMNMYINIYIHIYNTNKATAMSYTTANKHNSTNDIISWRSKSGAARADSHHV